MSWPRIRTDFRFAIVMLFAGVGALGVLPFAVFRLARGQLAAGAIDVFIGLCITAAGIYVWRGGNLERASRFTVVAYSAGSVAVASMVGTEAVPWMYPIFVANFLLLDRRLAMLASGLAMVALLVIPQVFEADSQRIIFLFTGLIVCALAYTFAYRTDSMRIQLENLASHDPLTGIYNRRAMERELAIAIDAFRRHRTPYGLAVVDLDHFKRINDTYGHEAGDRVLIEFARRVESSTRKGDRFFRFGGEEFVLLLPGTQPDSLHVFCEHLRERISTQLSYQEERITISIGAAALEPGEDAASWLARADNAVYQAKHLGRNQVVVHPGTATGDITPQGITA